MIGKAVVAALMISMVGFVGVGSATTLLLPPSNEMSTGTFGDFQVYSLELLDQCSAAGDPRCLPSGPFPVASGEGQISDQVFVYQGGASGNNNYTVQGPLAGPQSTTAVDNQFRPPSGSETTFNMVLGSGTGANEPGDGTGLNGVNTSPEFTGDIIGRWDAKLSSILSYLTSPDGTVNDLVFLFDNNQVGGEGQFLTAWGQVRIVDAAGNVINCFEFNINNSDQPGANTFASRCSVAPGETDPDPTGLFATVVGDFCVNAVTGVAYNFDASNQGDCTQTPGDYFITNNLGDDTAEFAIFNQLLNAIVQNPANGDLFMSINFKLTNLNDGDESLWICSNCNVTPPTQVPAPAALMLVGSGLLGVSLAAWRRSRRQ
jgi:hypothetical protein